MMRDVNRVGDGVPVPPTMAARPTAPEAPGNPELNRSARRDASPGRGRKATPSRSDTPKSAQGPATDKSATAPHPTRDRPGMALGGKPAMIGARPTASPVAPIGDRRVQRWFEMALFAVCLVAGAAGWWLYGSKVDNRVDMPLPPATRAGDDLAQVKQALQQERDKAEKLGGELAIARRELRSPAAASTKAGDAELRLALQQSEWLSATHQELLAQERARNQQLEQLLAARRNDQELLAQERARNQELEQQLEERRDDQELLAQERARNQELEQQLAARRDAASDRGRNATATLLDTPNPTQAPATDKSATAPLPKSDKPVMPAGDKPATTAARPTAPEAPGNPEPTRLMARARLLLGQGDIAGARFVLEHAVELGSAPALFVLAETYDPAILSAWGTFGTQGDVGKARELYAKALVGGVQQAADRLNALR
jgi:hypothetical protein